MKKRKEILSQPSMKLFVMLCGYFLTSYILYTACQMVRFQHCLMFVQIVSLSLPMIVYFLTLKKETSKKTSIILLSTYLILLVVLPFIYTRTYDLTIDGNSYHKTAIAFIKNGWNPLYEKSTEFQKNNPEVVPIDKKTKTDLWIEHYPKATWISSAIMYDMTGSIESGKAITLIFSIMLFIISYNCLQMILSRGWAVAFSILVVLNPITLSQIFTYYVDSIMGICFAMELLLLFLVNPMEKQNKFLWIAIAGVCTIFTNLKYTGLLCSGVIAAVFYFYWLLKYRKEKQFWLRFRNITFHFTVVFTIAIFFVGASSYVKNTIDHRNPLYPIIGEDKVDIITTMQPKKFNQLSMIEKFGWSLFSKTENVTYTSGDPEVKWPIKVYRSEIEELVAPDVRIAGFGPLFALGVIVSMIVFIISLIIFIKHEKQNIKYITLPLIAIITSMILVGENWWARYVPQFYLLIVGTMILAVYLSKYWKHKRYPQGAAIVIAAIMILNASCFSYAMKSSISSFIAIRKDLNEMYYMDNLKLKLGTEGLYGYYYNLKDRNIQYQVVEKIEQDEIRYMYSWRFEVEKNETVSKTN